MSEFLKTFDKLNDAQLRSSVKLLGKLLGNIIKSHAGDKVYVAVEKLRKGFINLRKDNNQIKHDQLIRYIGKLDPITLKNVIRLNDNDKSKNLLQKFFKSKRKKG